MSFGVFLAPYHPLGDSPLVTFRRDLQLIERCDELGFDEAWVGEHHSAAWENIADPAVFLAAAGPRTQRIRLGSGVVSLPYHHPMMVADRFVQLDYLTHGRAMLGVGPGALVSDAMMMGIDPVTQRPRMDEALGVIVRLLARRGRHARQRLVRAPRGPPADAAGERGAPDRRRQHDVARRHGVRRHPRRRRAVARRRPDR